MLTSESLTLPWEWLHRPMASKPLASLEALLGMTALYIIVISWLSYLMKDRRAKEASILKMEGQLKALPVESKEHADLKQLLAVEKSQYNPFIMTFITAPHNLIMCLYSLYAFVGVSLFLIESLQKSNWNFFALWCEPQEFKLLQEGLEYWSYTFYLSKYIEYLDTIFLLLKAKPIMPPGNSQYFLHIYHHAITAAIVWVTLQYNITTSWTGPLTNSFVHILMYGYYFLTELDLIDRNLGGKFITPIQLIQFVFCLASVLTETILGRCATHVGSVIFLFINYMIFFLFFAKVYYDKKQLRRATTGRRKKEE